MIDNKRYQDCSMSIVTHNDSGLIVARNYIVNRNFDVVYKRLQKMCQKHDLECKVYPHSERILCMIKSFENVNAFTSYIIGKMIKTKYSYQIKGHFALVTSESGKYVYRIAKN